VAGLHDPVGADVASGAGLKDHRGEVVGEATWPAIIDRATHDPDDVPAAQQGRGYGCRKDETFVCPGRVRIAAEPLEEYVAGYVIEMWKSPRALNIAQSDGDRMERIGKISREMAQLQEQKNEALRMKLRGEVDLPTYRAVTRELDAAHDQLAREHKSLTSEAAMPELPDPSLAWEDLSASDRRALTEMLVDKIIIERHPSKIDKDGRPLPHPRHPIPNPRQEAERLKAVHEARVKIVPRGLSSLGEPIAHRVAAATANDATTRRALPGGRDLRHTSGSHPPSPVGKPVAVHSSRPCAPVLDGHDPGHESKCWQSRAFSPAAPVHNLLEGPTVLSDERP
jgi:hypothetical protein